jgi:hypothetical protein
MFGEAAWGGCCWADVIPAPMSSAALANMSFRIGKSSILRIERKLVADCQVPQACADVGRAMIGTSAKRLNAPDKAERVPWNPVTSVSCSHFYARKTSRA